MITDINMIPYWVNKLHMPRSILFAIIISLYHFFNSVVRFSALGGWYLTLFTAYN